MAGLVDEIAAFSSSLEILSRTSFRLDGVTHSSVPEAEEGATDDPSLAPGARSVLADILYATLHCRRDQETSPNEESAWDAGDEREFMRELSNANSGSGAWRPGAVVRSVAADGGMIVEHSGLAMWIDAEEFIPDGGNIVPGSAGRVKFPNEYRALFPGHYVMLGDLDGDLGGETVRIYWHVTADGAAPLVSAISRTFNEAGVGFHFKVLSDPSGYRRTDSAVLYLASDDHAEAAPLVEAVRDSVCNFLRSPVSAFALALAPGLSLAEDPGSHVSFGEHRAAVVADALCMRPGLPRSREAIALGLRAIGYVPERFHMNPWSRHSYRAFERVGGSKRN